MRTTFIIDDALHTRVKECAAAQRRTATSLIEEALLAYLQRHATPEPFYFAPMGHGGTCPGVDLTNGASIQELLDDEAYADAPEVLAA
ncbi:MAG: type II toxin-antitoxin system VapB family antitoxin [Propionibacteriaceae bacterium]|jgi:hypothetical protein|nr:type II toxin-antitoxin system VapB family antitoxin [Propionibacteriaceae bacterium]